MHWDSDPEGRMIALVLWVALTLVLVLAALVGPAWLFVVVVALLLGGFLALVFVP